jgi:NAD(P)H-dependent flavin oxidoreductase YrpB (nitropropane dioxygenase family)
LNNQKNFDIPFMRETPMFKTRITDMLGIEYPIIQGGMLWLSTAELAAAVSNAGGFGIITALSCGSGEKLRAEIRKCKDLTAKPFGVNVSMLPRLAAGDKTEEYFDVIIEEGVVGVETAGRNPEPYLPRLKESGIKVIHKVPAVRFAQKAESAGVDAVTLVGFECGGLPGMDDVTTFILIQKATSMLRIPVVAGGGICDAKGFMAALALGADGVLMGTRFILTRECWAHHRIKERLLQATELDTVIVARSIQSAARAIKNRAAAHILEMEQRNATPEELRILFSSQGSLKALQEGDSDGAIIACGQVIGLIDELKTVQEVIEEMVKGAQTIYRRFGAIGIR